MHNSNTQIELFCENCLSFDKFYVHLDYKNIDAFKYLGLSTFLINRKNVKCSNFFKLHFRWKASKINFFYGHQTLINTQSNARLFLHANCINFYCIKGL